MRILVTPTFTLTGKQLKKHPKAALDEAVSTIARQLKAGETECGDLNGVHVDKFRMGTLLCLMAYRILNENTLKLLMVGPHENLYRELKHSDP